MTRDDAQRLVDRIRAIWPRPVMTEAREAEYRDAVTALEYGTVNAALDRYRDGSKFCPSIAELRGSVFGAPARVEKYTPRCRRMVTMLAQCTVPWIQARDQSAFIEELLIDLPMYWDEPRVRELSNSIREKVGRGASFEQWATEAGWLTEGRETLPPRRLFARITQVAMHDLIVELAAKMDRARKGHRP